MAEEEPVVTVKKVKKTKEAFVDDESDVVENVESDEEEEEEEEGDDDFQFDMDEMNLGNILQNFLVNDEGQNICEIMSGFKKSLDTQNKILMKFYNMFESRKN